MSLVIWEITDPAHPHYGERGTMTGETIRPLFDGNTATMHLFKLDNCPHGTDACYVQPGQFRAWGAQADAPQRPRGKR
jgi:hypothetical protein